MELLVAMGVLLVLASLLATALSSAKRKARLTQCISNLKQHGVALHSFLTDHSEYPLVLNPGAKYGVEVDHHSTIWRALEKHGLGPPIHDEGSVHVCPSGAAQKLPVKGADRPVAGYAYNVHGMGRRLEDEPLGLSGMAQFGKYLVVPVPEGAVVNPSGMIAMGDGVRGWNEVYEDGVAFIARTPDVEEYAGSNQRVPQRHKGRLVILFADGHVNPLTLRQLFSDTSDEALRMWNRDNQPHRERLK